MPFKMKGFSPYTKKTKYRGPTEFWGPKAYIKNTAKAIGSGIKGLFSRNK